MSLLKDKLELGGKIVVSYTTEIYPLISLLLLNFLIHLPNLHWNVCTA